MGDFYFDKFDSMVDLDDLCNAIDNAGEGSTEYEEVPYGTYEVKIEKMELVTTKKDDMPMVSIWFKILEGKYKNSMIFFNKKIMGTKNDGFMIHQCNEFLKSLDSGLEIGFEKYSKYAKLLMDIHEAIDGKLEYSLQYSEEKGFAKYEILDVFEVEN